MPVADMVKEKEHSNVLIPTIFTIVTHGLLVLLFIFFIIKTPNPPYPDNGGPGMEVNLGFSEDGMGEIQPETYNPNNPNPNNNANQNNATANQNNDENVVTNIEGENIKIKTNPKNQTHTTTTNNNVPQIDEPKVNPLALFKASDGGSEGETGKPGDQGNPNGDPNAKNHYGTPGDGNRPGNGGNGNGYSLGNRNIKGSLPKPTYPGNEQGKVVVEIFVDRSGVVIKANAGVKGSTLLSKNYLDAAYSAALRAKFDANPDAPEVQKGSITYKFMFQ